MDRRFWIATAVFTALGLAITCWGGDIDGRFLFLALVQSLVAAVIGGLFHRAQKVSCASVVCSMLLSGVTGTITSVLVLDRIARASKFDGGMYLILLVPFCAAYSAVMAGVLSSTLVNPSARG